MRLTFKALVASRYDTYQVGQRMILLLKKEKKFYYILSAGGEGEMPIISDSVSIPLNCLAYADQWKIGDGVRSDSLSMYRCKVGNKSFVGLHIPLKELISSIFRLKASFLLINKDLIECSDFIVKQDLNSHINYYDDKLFFLLSKDFYEQKKKYCH